MQIVDVSARPMGGSLVIGEVVRFHVDDAVIERLQDRRGQARAVGRMSGSDYARTRDRFSLIRPA